MLIKEVRIILINLSALISANIANINPAKVNYIPY
jgi:hypothetical protein